MSDKIRLDILILGKYPELSRNKIQNLIAQGAVKSRNEVLKKAGMQVPADFDFEIDFSVQKYVGRGGYKLEKALQEFKIDVSGLICLDCGVSTGGFSDCLLQSGASKVYGVDVGIGQTNSKLVEDPRFVLIEKTNLKELQSLPQKVDLVTLDLSFISLLKVLSAVVNLMTNDGKIIALIKPQFELERNELSRGGVVRDKRLHQKVIKKIEEGVKVFGLEVKQIIDSPIFGSDGNKEFLALIEKK
ncbi:TPA: TlyA family rRNA (cytidine-2'-O)-methyltransferase [Candidatus Dependentiae bacterium]|nr:MAG: hypothetical protein UR14_C0006G0064 [candidate division TM6 bacterium GW2011_GWE2_31_21]KKP53513.1 MAG: hypothetical protein UR43_C0004G0054 [candidate division TM6 bacterium GW2011_GWF2_33_332]HBS48246.1 TlyA family rRNA (cytidine-2'-O)-methyltransferase [Candidatus Dependentiae bacterium]HBZ73672.1 TlyA family rRNA (cytidine-2'-O)-methyltransferase [Candidatus Dependentiae bacterium]